MCNKNMHTCNNSCCKKEALNLRESGEGAWEGLEGKKGREICNYIIISKLKLINARYIYHISNAIYIYIYIISHTHTRIYSINEKDGRQAFHKNKKLFSYRMFLCSQNETQWNVCI